MRYLCIALCQKKEELKLNKLSKISGLSRWEAKATKHKLGVRNGWGSGVAANRWVPHPTPSVYCEALRPPRGHEVEVKWHRRSVSGFSASLRYFFGAGSSCGRSCAAVTRRGGSVSCVCAGRAGLCLLGDRSRLLL